MLPKILMPTKKNSRACAWAWALQQNIMGLSFEHTQLILKHTQQKRAEHHLDIWLKEVDDVLQKGKEHLNTNYEGVSNTSRVAHVERKDKVVKYPNQEEKSKRRMEPQIQKKRKNEARAMNPII